jgi:glutaredoxin-related protein
MIDWVAKKTDKDVKKDVDKVDEIVHDNNMTMADALKEYKKKIGDDYENWTLGSKALLSADNIEKRIKENSVIEFKNGIDHICGSKYIKVIRRDNQTSVHSFIVNIYDDDKFKYGDILKASSWKTPARNFARGNIFENYKVRWVGM